ncbi:L-histidine N(alpha)-methyltransferase [Leptothoe sp. PORK10 BA2]|uniref:L-histidine N(alpha)-methyltransferase n=1 Tax=Leptothoe sp. PORK10 BA2 TaxID=3110254 RepID=UPI002B1EA3AD|nr:L-histidine N(alpha)-methyltransferase [Leptothoe sp. PORK10 BA2]MEA5462408.1 L-histidine N(alpha)-methyltransferase [Leptothoe sp. PORK10 BA2]
MISPTPLPLEKSTSTPDGRFQTVYLDSPEFSSGLEGQDVIEGLTQSPKVLPPKYFYDDRGSQLFEQICGLPEYYPTRTEAWILQHYARAIAQATGACELVELGSGSSTKTRLLLDAYQAQGHPLYYQPIDVSAGILADSAAQLLTDYPTLQVQALVGTYGQALNALPTPARAPRLLLFLGSSLGNFTPLECDQFFAQVASVLEAGDYFLLGIDLQKDTAILEAAYNDCQGVTAAFNLNMLAHLNYRFTGNFNLEAFHHQAIYNPEDCQIEMYLRCQQPQSVQLKTLDLSIELTPGESIRTEISRKFNLEQMQHYLQVQGLSPVQTWTDPMQWFGVILCRR